MERQAFEAVMRATLASLPEKFRAAVTDVDIVIDARPDAGRRGKSVLLGLYEGVPLTEWGREYGGKMPDTITLYQKNIEEYALDEQEIPHVIRETLLHEIGHHLGLGHDRIGPMERRWKKARKKNTPPLS